MCLFNSHYLCKCSWIITCYKAVNGKKTMWEMSDSVKRIGNENEIKCEFLCLCYNLIVFLHFDYSFNKLIALANY